MSKLLKIINSNNIDLSKIDVFVETGLYAGDTLNDLKIQNILDKFKNVYSIEIEKRLIDMAYQKYPFFNVDKNIEIINGDSSVELKSIINKHKQDKVLFWLDAHFSGQGTGKSQTFGECPLLGELDLISKLNIKPIIIIDDITLFIDFPESIKHNHDINDWPNINKIKEKIESLNFDLKIKIDTDLSYLIAY